MKTIRFDVFGLRLDAEHDGARWRLYEPVEHGRRSPLDLPIPAAMSDEDLAAHLADLYQDAASPLHPEVRRLDSPRAEDRAGPVGLLLAAGRGVRYDASGRTLKLLEPASFGPHAGSALAVAAARNLLAAVGAVIAVVRPATDENQLRLRSLLAAEGCELVECEAADQGMGASLACGVAASRDACGWLVALADMPAILPTSIAAVAQAINAGALCAAPCHAGRRGHPVGFAAALGAELMALTGEAGAREVLARHPPQSIEVKDAGVLLDVDTP
ncbi:MAG: nucleotidyltransferase family protein [Burkholderiaceae bacterium]